MTVNVICRNNSHHQPYISRVLDGVKIKMSTFRKRHAGLTCGFVFAIDTYGMLRLSQSLRGSFAARRALGRAMFIAGIAIALTIGFGKDVTQASEKPFHIKNIKLHAYNKLTWEQFECYNWLIHHESRWSPTARNGSHYGLGQMRSKWYGTLNPIKQIDAHLDYIKHRYKGQPCLALAHWERKGWH